jgi:ATP-dependent phosphofructokinase / diphosphate-dependent phosphofructokinase
LWPIMEEKSMQDSIHRIGILTGGGDAPGLNAVIRAVVKTALNQYGWEVLGIEDGYEGLLFKREARRLTTEDVRGTLHLGGTILGTSNRGNPFAYSVTVNGREEIRNLSQDAMEHIRELGLDCLIVVGGDGTMNIALQLSKLGARVVGIPKTIDNDLNATDITFGFDTALHTATDALDKLHSTAESHHRVMILEVMGRDAGWIAIESGLAGGADVILIPEIPFRPESVCQSIEARDLAGRKFSLVVVAEGARPIHGSIVYQEAGGADRLPRLGGIGNQLAEMIRSMCSHDVRVTVLGHVQRGGSPSPFDRILATRLGTAAVHLIAAGGFGKMVALRNTQIVPVDMQDAIGVPKRVQPDGELARVARGLGISLGE